MQKHSTGTRRKGRSLELLVSRIKEHQAPDAIIRSPEFVSDRDTGQQREVDIGIHAPRNGDSVFIAIECRDRGAMQSVEWVEQLICKKHSIGADVLVAITSSNFSMPARIKALKHGVILGRMTKKLPEELAQLASSFFIKLRYLNPTILGVDLQIPSHLSDDLDAYKYKHKLINEPLSLIELAQVWSNPNLIRTIPKFVTDWNRDKFAKIGLSEIDAEVISDGESFPIQRARITYELGYGEMELPLRAIQELTALDDSPNMDATAYQFGTETDNLSELIVDVNTGTFRWDLLGSVDVLPIR